MPSFKGLFEHKIPSFKELSDIRYLPLEHSGKPSPGFILHYIFLSFFKNFFMEDLKQVSIDKYLTETGHKIL